MGEQLIGGDSVGKERTVINLNVDVDVDGAGVGRWNGELLEDQHHVFQVGDFVWGKVKNDPWWPGQIYDPRDASDIALKHSQEGRLLVAFFGDGSCSWCLPSQLIPFVENLEESLRDGSLNLNGVQRKSFFNAVQRAVDEIGRLMESRVTCGCIPLEKRSHLARPVVSNAGVKAGVLMPEVDVGRFPITEYAPSEILAKVCGFAKTPSFDGVLDLAMLRSWLSAYSYAKWGRGLTVYSDPAFVEGLEDNDHNVSSPEVVESISLLKVEKKRGPSNDENSGKRKSVAKLMENKQKVVKPKTRVIKDGGGGEEGPLSVKRRRIQSDEVSASAETRDESSDEIKENMGHETGFSSRKRKKSKYLSPPYTDLLVTVSTTASQEEDSSPFTSDLETDDETPNAKGATASDDENTRGAATEIKATFPASDVSLDVHELLLKMQSAALGFFDSRHVDYHDPICAFISAFRSSTFVRGADHKIHLKNMKAHHEKKHVTSLLSSRPRRLSPTISPPVKRHPGKRASSQPITDDLASDARAVGQKIDSMAKILETYDLKLSKDDKCWVKDAMKRLSENVETAIEKVRFMAGNFSN